MATVWETVKEEIVHLHGIAHYEAIETNDLAWIRLEIAYRRLLDGRGLTPMQAKAIASELVRHAETLTAKESVAMHRLVRSILT